MIAVSAIQAEARTLLAAHAELSAEVILLGATLLLFPVATVARASNVATIVTSSAHHLITGARVDLAGITTAGFDESHAEVTVVNPTTFTYANTGANVATTADATGTVRAQDVDLCETALRNRGHCLTIFAPLTGEVTSQAPGKASVEVSIAVRVDVNEEKATKEPFTLVHAVTEALLQRVCETVNRYTLDDPAFVMDDTDPGLVSYLVYFKRNATL